MKRTLGFLLALCLMVTCLTGCALSDATELKTFEKDGLSITLTDAFTESEHETYSACYTSSQIAVFILRQDMGLFTGGDVEVDVPFYLELVMESNAISSELKQNGDVPYFVFQKTVDSVPYTYYAFGYQTEDAFWLVQLCCESKNAETLEPTILQYASSVKFG